MSTVFLKKSWKSWLLGFLSLCVFISCCIYAFVIARAKVLVVNKTFYFLVSTNTHVQASAYELEWQGGAGYLLDYQGKEYAVMSLYLSENTAETVFSSLDKQNTNLLVCTVDKLYLFKNTHKKQISALAYALDGVYACITSLNAEISRLERGATQQSCARVLEAISVQLLTFAKACEKVLQGYTKEIVAIFERLKEKANEIIFAKDLRYEVCALGDLYLKICKEYAI